MDGVLSSSDGPTRLVSLSDGGYLDMTYSTKVESLIFNVHLQTNTYIGLGFGATMADAEIVQWSANAEQS